MEAAVPVLAALVPRAEVRVQTSWRKAGQDERGRAQELCGLPVLDISTETLEAWVREDRLVERLLHGIDMLTWGSSPQQQPAQQQRAPNELPLLLKALASMIRPDCFVKVSTCQAALEQMVTWTASIPMAKTESGSEAGAGGEAESTKEAGTGALPETRLPNAAPAPDSKTDPDHPGAAGDTDADASQHGDTGGSVAELLVQRVLPRYASVDADTAVWALLVMHHSACTFWRARAAQVTEEIDAPFQLNLQMKAQYCKRNACSSITRHALRPHQHDDLVVRVGVQTLINVCAPYRNRHPGLRHMPTQVLEEDVAKSVLDIVLRNHSEQRYPFAEVGVFAIATLTKESKGNLDMLVRAGACELVCDVMRTVRTSDLVCTGRFMTTLTTLLSSPAVRAKAVECGICDLVVQRGLATADIEVCSVVARPEDAVNQGLLLQLFGTGAACVVLLCTAPGTSVHAQVLGELGACERLLSVMRLLAHLPSVWQSHLLLTVLCKALESLTWQSYANVERVQQAGGLEALVYWLQRSLSLESRIVQALVQLAARLAQHDSILAIFSSLPIVDATLTVSTVLASRNQEFQQDNAAYDFVGLFMRLACHAELRRQFRLAGCLVSLRRQIDRALVDESKHVSGMRRLKTLADRLECT